MSVGLSKCPECGEEFKPRIGGGKPQKYCSKACTSLASNRAWRDRNRPDLSATCAECGGPVEHAERGRPRRFCSEKCKARAGNRRVRRSQLPAPKPSERTCVHCGKPFTPKRSDSQYCYDGWCVQLAYQKRKRAGEPLRQVERVVKCDECGGEFTAKHTRARWCSSACQIRHRARVASRRRVSTAGSSPYTDREIFERDGWRCHLCKKKVRQDLPRTHPDGATIDHLVPLSDGGLDDPANVATAHGRCNRDKRVRPMNEQLRLV